MNSFFRQKLSQLARWRLGSSHGRADNVHNEWEQTFNAMNAALWVLDKDQRILRANRQAQLLFNGPGKKIYGSHCWEIAHGTAGPVEGCPFLKTQQSLKRETMELNLKNRWFEVIVDPILDSSQQLVKAIHIVTDITDTKLLQDQLAARSQQVKNLFNAIKDAIFVHPFKKEGFGTFVEVNDIACTRYGYARDEFLTLSPPDITLPVNGEAHRRSEHRKRLLAAEHMVFEAVHIKKSGEQFPVEINANIFYQLGTPYILAVVRDITVRKQEEKKRDFLICELQEALEKINHLKGLIPICASCKKIRDDKGYWNQLESYIEKYSQAEFSHSICPECTEKLYGQEKWYIRSRKSEDEG